MASKRGIQGQACFEPGMENKRKRLIESVYVTVWLMEGLLQLRRLIVGFI